MKEKISEDIKVKLSEYCDIKQEILDLNKKIRKLEGKDVVIDYVEASSKIAPYTKRKKQIVGFNKSLQIKMVEYKDLLNKRYEKLLEKQIELEEFIDTLPTSRLRRIFELRFIEQYTWRQIAYAIGGNTTEESVRKEYERCF